MSLRRALTQAAVAQVRTQSVSASGDQFTSSWQHVPNRYAIALVLTANMTGAVDLVLQDSADDSSFADVSGDGALTIAVTAGDDFTTLSGFIDQTYGLREYLRFRVNADGANGALGCIVVQFGDQYDGGAVSTHDASH